MNHAEVTKSAARGREISLPDPILHHDVICSLRCSHNLLNCDYLFTLQNGPGIKYYWACDVYNPFYGKKY